MQFYNAVFWLDGLANMLVKIFIQWRLISHHMVFSSGKLSYVVTTETHVWTKDRIDEVA